METSSSVYTWETGGDDSVDSGEEAKTVPTTAAAWSPEQTPKQGSSRHTTPVIGAGKAVFEKEVGPEVVMGMRAELETEGLVVPESHEGRRPLSVGVAI